MNFGNVNDIWQAWTSLAATISRGPVGATVDHVCITPAIIAIGDIPDSKVEELQHILENSPALLLNLSGKPLSPMVKASLRNQILDAQWRTPCQYSRAPTLDTVFSLCRSIKSWCDLSEKHRVLVHCPPGQGHTGIVIACLLKYIGAFRHAAHAYDFYCNKRLTVEQTRSLTPSYRNLFVNVDRMVDVDGYEQASAKFLKTITVAGLPVDDIPCVEVWDSSGVVFSSHSGMRVSPQCTWNDEYSDGFYKVEKFLLGDFAIVCRFGGALATTKEKSTLIFKYQHSTAFLSEEVKELRFADVDVNPQYADSLDVEIFKVHLMFDHAQSPPPHCAPSLAPFPAYGTEAFKAGLDEITKMHIVIPDASKYHALSPCCAEQFVAVSLQLANNSLADAERVAQLITQRLDELTNTMSEHDSDEANDASQEEEPEERGNEEESESEKKEQDGVDRESERGEVSPSLCPRCREDANSDQLVQCSACAQQHHTYCVGLRRIPFSREKDKDAREKYIQHHFGSWCCEKCVREEEISREKERESLSVPVSTSLSESSKTIPSERELLSLKEAASGGGVIVTDSLRSLSPSRRGALSASVAAAPFVTPAKRAREKSASTPMRHLASSALRSRQDHVAMLVAALASASVSVEELLRLPADRQKEALLRAVGEKFPEWAAAARDKAGDGGFDLATTLRHIIKQSNGNAADILRKTSKRDDVGGDNVNAALRQRGPGIATSSAAGGDANSSNSASGNAVAVSQTKSEAEPGGAFNARAQMLEFMKSRMRGASSVSSAAQSGAERGGMGMGMGVGGGGSGSGFGGVGMGTGPGGQGGQGGGMGGGQGGGAGEAGFFGGGPGTEGGTGGGGGGPGGAIAMGGPGGGMGGAPGGPATMGGFGFGGYGMGVGMGGPAMGMAMEGGFVPPEHTGLTGREIPEYQKYFKMIKAGLPKNTVVEKIVADGVLASQDIAGQLLSLREDEPIPNSLANKLRVLVTLATHPKYVKFFNMLRMGVSKDIVKEKMEQEGVDAEVIDKNGEEKVPLFDGPLVMEKPADAEEKKEEGEQMVKACEHPKYAKYFKMLKTGVPKQAIMNKMQAEGVDSSVLEKDPDTMIPLEEKKEESKAEGEQMVKACEHPKYGKYFKMVKTGVPKQAVMNKMQAEGLDPSILDKDPESMIPLEDKKDEGEEMVKACEHPKYAKFFKMLKTGVPKQAVMNKMQAEGLDPTVLDKDPESMIPLEDKKDDEEEMVKACEHPKYGKFFKMVKTGVPKQAVMNKMQAEGLDPTVLDKDPESMIPLGEGKPKKAKSNVKTVKAEEHPKYAKFFKMLKTGVPKQAIMNKMKAEGVDPSVLEKDGQDLIPLEDETEDSGPMVKACEHPAYAKYFKMLKTGVPPPAVMLKMKAEGVDPSVLEKDPETMIPLDDKKKESSGKAGAAAAAAKPKARKKKLHLKGVDVSKLNSDSLWADDNESLDIMLDEEEFNKLFVESTAEESKKVVAKPAKEPKKQKVVLIDMKRAQNGSIALARIKFKHDDLKTKVLNMDDQGLTPDQLKSMMEFLPKGEEIDALRAFAGDEDSIGTAEKYMRTMLSCSYAKQRITCMIYKQLFRGRYSECYEKIKKIEQACDDVKMSGKLKKVLKTILKVGNQLNDGEEHKGFSVESLLKLQSAKAFDKKTTVLTYVVRLIARNDYESLKFPEELKNISDASRITMDMIISEKGQLKQEFDANFKIVEDIRTKEPDSNTDAMIDFFAKADELCKKLDAGLDKVKDKFNKVLEYFGEDPNLSSQDFFTTLSRFVQEFATVREGIERERKAEEKRQAQAQAQEAKSAPRRHNSMFAAPNKDSHPAAKAESKSTSALPHAKDDSHAESKSPDKSSIPRHAPSAKEHSSAPPNRNAALQELLSKRAPVQAQAAEKKPAPSTLARRSSMS